LVAHHKKHPGHSVFRSKVFPILVVCAFIAAAGAAAGTNGDRQEPHQYYDVNDLRKFTDYDLTHYVAGMADAVAYITAERAVGKAVSKCLMDHNDVTVVRHQIYFKWALEKASGEVPSAQVYLNLLREWCASYLEN
tara:strand:- start:441 stop:848 length:408 start_codon:yes stop_codon:yes gene_type:complete